VREREGERKHWMCDSLVESGKIPASDGFPRGIWYVPILGVNKNSEKMN